MQVRDTVSGHLHLFVDKANVVVAKLLQRDPFAGLGVHPQGDYGERARAERLFTLPVLDCGEFIKKDDRLLLLRSIVVHRYVQLV